MVKAAKAMAELRQGMPALLEMQVALCQLAWRRFTQLRREGFSEAQAIVIVSDNFTKMV